MIMVYHEAIWPSIKVDNIVIGDLNLPQSYRAKWKATLMFFGIGYGLK